MGPNDFKVRCQHLNLWWELELLHESRPKHNFQSPPTHIPLSITITGYVILQACIVKCILILLCLLPQLAENKYGDWSASAPLAPSAVGLPYLPCETSIRKNDGIKQSSVGTMDWGMVHSTINCIFIGYNTSWYTPHTGIDFIANKSSILAWGYTLVGGETEELLENPQDALY